MFTRLIQPFTLGLGLGLSLLSATAVTAQSITGSGTISVVVGGTWATADPANSTVGCINAAGKVTMDDCATFTVADYHITTAEGVCSFHNSSQPANTDDVYGDYVYALTCWDHAMTSTDVQFYTVNGFTYEWLCQGDVNCYYDIPAIPTSSDEEIDIWYFVWGGDQTGVPPGHSQALLLWEPST